jgi:hypothetical protein
VTIVEDEQGRPLDVGRKTRSIPPALRRALDSRDRGCLFPGCTHWRGEPMDYGLAIDVLLAKERRARLQRQLDGPSRALRPSIS